LSAIVCGTRDHGHRLERIVRTLRATRPAKHAARAFRRVAGRREHSMNLRRAGMVCAALLALAACSKGEDPGYQGWVEADLIFVSPDEYGRVQTLSVREGDVVEQGAPLFAVDPDIQQADVDMAKAALINANQALERAQTLLRTAAGTQKTVEDAE